MPTAGWQRCRTQYGANLMAICSKSAWPGVEAMLHSVYDQPDPASVHARYDKLLDTVADTLPKVHAHLDAARDDILAFTAFPREVWRQTWSSNPNDRLNREIRRRTDVLRIFPDATPSSGWSAPYSPNSTTNGPKAVASSAWRSSPAAA